MNVKDHTVTAEQDGGKYLHKLLQKHIQENTKPSFRNKTAILADIDATYIHKIVKGVRHVPFRDYGKRDKTIAVINTIIQKANENSK